VLQNVHDAIVTVDKNLTVIPSLAKSFEQSPDGLIYTFHLRPSVKFHDGKTMTSTDVKYSFDRCRDKKTGAVNFEVFNDVASIETPDDLTGAIHQLREGTNLWEGFLAAVLVVLVLEAFLANGSAARTPEATVDAHAPATLPTPAPETAAPPPPVDNVMDYLSNL